MSTWLDLALREAVILAVLAALGAGPAAFLRGTQAGSRIALAPALGLALGGTALVSAAHLIALGTAAWAVLLPMSLISLALAVTVERRQDRSGEGNARLATGLKLGLLLVVVTSALNYPLAHRESLGPIAYRVSDASYYVAVIDRLESHRARDESEGPPWDLTSDYGKGVARSTDSPMGASALAASVNSLFGWRASDTQSALMIVLVVLVSLGAFAAVQEFTRSRTWAAPLAGVLMAGPFTYQLFVDGSQGGLSFLALVPPLAVLLSRMIRQPRAADVVLTALLLAAGPSLYQAGAPTLAAWAAVVVAMIGVAAARQHRLGRDAVLRTAKIIAVVAVLAIAFAPVAFARGVDFYPDYLAHQYDAAGIPYKLPLAVIASWVLQSRGLYDIQDNPGTASSLWQLLLTVVVPLALAAVAIFGVMRYRRAWVVAALVPTAAVLAYRVYLGNETPLATYAVDRSLLVVAVAGTILLAVGLAALSASARTALRIAAVAIAAVALVLAGRNSYDIGRRVLEGGRIVPASVRQSLPDLRGRQGSLYLEGLGAVFPNASLEMSAIYNLVNEATPNRLAVDMTNNDYSGPPYLGGFARADTSPGEPLFDPGYGLVLTLIPGVQTARVPVARAGSIEIQQRTRPLDVTVGSGIAIDPPSRASEGNAWIQGQMKLVVTGASRGPVWVRLDLEGRDVHPVAPQGARIVTTRPGGAVICVPVAGSGAVRQTVLSLGFEVQPSPVTSSRFATPLPNRSLRLAGMWAVRDC